LATSAADAPSNTQDQAVQDYLEMQRKSEATYERNFKVYLGVVAVVFSAVGGMIVFGVLPLARRSKESLELNKQQQKTLEEIRDLLKKQ
jgi:hypothetical protein